MRKVLIVDDEAEIRSALATYYPWSELGFVVAGRASCAAEARAAIEVDAIAAVLCDIRMPGESGLEFAAWLAASHPGIKLVLLSAYRKFEYAQEAFRYGVKGYLVKPPSEEEFRAVFGAVARELEAEELEAREAALSAEPTRSSGELAPGGTAQGILGENALSESDPILADIRAYLRGNLPEACLKAAARAAGMNPTYFSTWFRQRTGRSFSDTVSSMRMEKAARLLGEEGFSVAQAGIELGYSNPKNFSRAFRRHFGSSPRAYLRLNLGPGRD
jgi:two-component system, response regulator YesN